MIRVKRGGIRPLTPVLGAILGAAVLAACGSSSSGSTSSSPSSGGTSSSASAPATTGGSSTAPSSSGKPVHIAFFSYNTTPYPEAGFKAAQAEAAKVGATVTFFQSNSDPSLQSTQMRDALTSHKYQAFYIWPNNAVALLPIVKQATAAGIKVGVADATLGSTAAEANLQTAPGVTITAGVGLKQEADTAIAEIEKACTAKVGQGKPCNVAIQPGLTGFPPDAYRIGIMQPALQKTGHIKVMMMPQGQYSTPGGESSTLNFFQANHGIDVMFSFGDQMVAGDLNGFKQLKLTPGKDVKVIGFGATTEAVAGIKAGTWFGSIGLYPSTESRLAVKYLVDAVHGQKVPATVNTYSLPGDLPAIDAATLKSHPDFTGDWSYAG